MKTRASWLVVAATVLAASASSGCGDDTSSDDPGDETGSTGASSDPSATEASTSSASSPDTDAETDSSSDTEGDTDSGGDVELEMLSSTERLIRISMALRGTRPSLQQLAAVEDDPDALEGIVDNYLESPEFGATIRNLHNESFLARPDYFYYPAGFPAFGDLAGEDPYYLNSSIMDAPLRLVEHVVMNDLPYSEIVTADYTMANDIVATVWGLDHSGGSDWEMTRWEDGRENAGVLSDSWFFQRHRSTASNANRGRANAVATSFLCSDFLSVDVDVDVNIDLSDPEAVANAVLENPSCATCHANLDPLASYFRGFNPVYVPTDVSEGDPAPGYPMELPWYAEFFPELLDVPQQPAAYYGTEGDGLAFLGDQIAQDFRFTNCAARRFYAYLHQTSLDDVSDEDVETYSAVLTDSGEQAKALAKAIVMADDFQIARVVPVDAQNPTEDELAVADAFGLLKARPEALGAMMEDLTGFSWVVDLTGIGAPEDSLGLIPMLNDSFVGYGVLAGGVDAQYVVRPSHTYNGTASLVIDALAREAAHFVVENDATEPANARILFGASPEDTDEATVRDELVAMNRRFYGDTVSADDPAIDADYDVFRGALEITSDASRAWKTTLTGMLQDARVAYY